MVEKTIQEIALFAGAVLMGQHLCHEEEATEKEDLEESFADN